VEQAMIVLLTQLMWPLKRCERLLTFYNEHGCVRGEVAVESDAIEHAREALRDAHEVVGSDSWMNQP